MSYSCYTSQQLEITNENQMHREKIVNKARREGTNRKLHPISINKPFLLSFLLYMETGKD